MATLPDIMQAINYGHSLEEGLLLQIHLIIMQEMRLILQHYL
ncbi:14230_t:CDS:2 [Funneliformis geosporum]|uniref:14230_t:CDS:1 n=1 Tax=Funneliformis geosporum TaxID=1117311 RepID=A0A9W4WR97_9GLOM|nr:14230_t:CDS:2 [Funneliformis geosporum]